MTLGGSTVGNCAHSAWARHYSTGCVAVWRSRIGERAHGNKGSRKREDGELQMALSVAQKKLCVKKYCRRKRGGNRGWCE